MTNAQQDELRHMGERSLPAAQGRANVQKEISDHLASIVLSLDEEEKDERRRDLEEFLRLTAAEQGMDQMSDHSHAFIAELTADERCPISARLYLIYELSNARMKIHDEDGRNSNPRGPLHSAAGEGQTKDHHDHDEVPMK